MCQIGYAELDGKKLILFDVEVAPNVILKRNRVALNSVLARWLTAGQNDAAIGIFHSASAESYRFTFARKSVHFNDKGEIVHEQTSAKRYTYIFGEGKHCSTAITRFKKLHDLASVSLDDIEDAFSVEALTKQFYDDIFAWYQWAQSEEVGITFPDDNKEGKRVIDVHLIRLITRLMFVWFIKQKDLVPECLFQEKYLGEILKDFEPTSKSSGNYYNAILQNLFFATLNNEISQRGFATDKRFNGKAEDFGVKTLFRNPANDSWFRISNDEVLKLFSTVPFLNGGLFECLDKDTPDSDGRIVYTDGFSRVNRRDRRAFIPNDVFFGDKGIIPLLSRYNFTVEENSPSDQQVALDPELLGKVFENLLGAYNQETQETARKESGSFYTPREVVNYMVDEALIAALGDSKEMRQLFQNEALPECLADDPSRCAALAKRIRNLRILDPACGSGAFPMGLLNRMVDLLQRLEHQTENPYEQKLHLIENCIFGIDIQTIAVQISKLRCFISLICEQERDDSKENFGILSLPNLENTFVAANSLLTLPPREQQGSLFENPEIDITSRELKAVRHRHFNARRFAQKKECRRLDKQLREKLANLLESNEYCDRNDARKLAEWNPYDQNTSSGFFDMEWMFGFSDGFDIVIGNPPYIQLQNKGGELADLYSEPVNGNEKKRKSKFVTFARTGDIYSLFYEQGYNFLKPDGHLCYITSNKWMRAGYGEATRDFFAKKTNPILLIDFAGQKIFESATVDTNILLFAKSKNSRHTKACIARAGCRNNLSLFVQQNSMVCQFSTSESWTILSPIEQSIKRKIEAVGTPLKDWDISINYGIKTGCNEAFIINAEKRQEILDNCRDDEERRRTDELIRPILRGRDIRRYGYDWANLYLIATFPARHYDIEQYPAVKKHFLTFDRGRLEEAGRLDLLSEDKLHQFCRGRLDQTGSDILVDGEKIFIAGKVQKSRKQTGNKWFETQDQIGYWDDFSRPKIVWGEISDRTKFALDVQGKFVPEATTFLMTGKHLKYLLYFLNSTLSEYLFSKIGTTTGVGTVRWKKFKVESIFVPNWSQEREFDLCQVQIDSERHACANQVKIDDFIFNLCGLNAAEREHIVKSSSSSNILVLPASNDTN